MPRGSKPALNSEQDQQVVAAYAAGKSARVIAVEMDTTQRIVLAALARCGVTRRSLSEYGWQETSDTRAEIVHLFYDGLSVQHIAHQIKTRNENVSRVLHDAGIDPRYGGPHRRFSEAEAHALAAEHATGASLAELARRHDSNVGTVRKTLLRIGVESTYRKRQKFWTIERENWLVEQYESGRSQEDIARELGYNQAAISSRLRQLGVLTRCSVGRGENHPSWKGGRTVDRKGYVRVLVPDDELHLVTRTMSGGYVLEHRLIMARALGRPLTKTETVHHINGNHADNRLENLQLRQGAHGKGVRMICLDCGSHNVAARSLTDSLA